MIYREYLVMRKAVLWFLVIVAACMTVIMLMSATQHGGSRTNGTLTEFSNPLVWIEMIFAAIFGVALGNASREPARVMWVLPRARWMSALGVIAVDVAAFVVAYFGLFVAMLIPLYVLALARIIQLDVQWSLDPLVVIRELGFVCGVYGWSTVIGMLGRRIAYAGLLIVPLGLFWEAMAGGASAFSEFLRKATIVANPYAVFSNVGVNRLHHANDPLVQQLSWITPQLEVAVFAAILLGTCAVAVALWQRAEVVT